MKGIATCEDCPINITIYRFTGNQGFFKVPEKWCEECEELGLENQTKWEINKPR